MNFKHGGKDYHTVPAKDCTRCSFYWRDGGIYDACDHPNPTIVPNTCGVEMRKRGVNLAWEITCDESKNTPETRARNELTLDVRFFEAPMKYTIDVEADDRPSIRKFLDEWYKYYQENKVPLENIFTNFGFENVVARPDGKVDATREGKRYIGITWPTIDTKIEECLSGDCMMQFDVTYDYANQDKKE